MPNPRPAKSDLPPTMGRFQIVRLLGQGAQSTVYVAFDPQLQREVALKALTLQSVGGEMTEAMLHEARAVSQLSHPAIVPVFEAGEHQGQPYLVFEYVPGQTLADRLRTAGAMSPERAVHLMLPVLEAVAFAHSRQVIHRDLKPSNILLDAHGRARVMDFGIAVRQTDANTASFTDRADATDSADSTRQSGALVGTPAYMAPEYARDGVVSVQMDVFSAGLIFFELLCGRRAVPEENGLQAIAHVVKGTFRLPADTHDTLDDRLRAIINRALMRDRSMRQGSMQELVDDLREWLLAPATSHVPGGGLQQAPSDAGALEFLLRRMRLKSDFPSLSESISRINRLASSDRQNVGALSDAILRDVALTQKILRMVNSSIYKGLGGGSVSTISRAIMIVGYDAVRRVATSLMLFEHMKDRGQAGRLLDEFLLAQFAGVAGRELCGLPEREAEEAFICCAFHNLGRMLAQYYFPDEAAEIRRLGLDQPEKEDSAAIKVLGLDYRRLGAGVAQSWGFAPTVIRSMQGYPAGGVVPAPHSRADLLQVVSGLAGELTRAARLENAGHQARALALATQRYGRVLGVSSESVRAALRQATQEVRDMAENLRIDLSHCEMGRRLVDGAGLVAVPSLPGSAAAEVLTTGLRPDPVGSSAAAAVPAAPAWVEAAADPHRQELLAAGIQEVTRALVSDSSAQDVLRMVMEILHTGMGFDHVALCLRDARSANLVARMTVGAVDKAVARMQVPMADRTDIFAAAVLKGVDLYIADVSSPVVLTRIPKWYRSSISAHTFLLLPLQMQGQPVGLIYADRRDAGSIRMTEKELALMRTLRNQVVLVLRQNSGSF